MKKYTSFFYRRKTIGYLGIFLYWLFNINLLTAISFFSIRSFVHMMGVDIDAIEDTALTYWISNKQWLESILFCVFITILFIVVEEIANVLRWERFSFGKIILVKSTFYILGFTCIFFSIYFILGISDFFEKQYLGQLFGHIMFKLSMAAIMVYLIVLVVVLNFIILTVKKVGANNLINFITGKYYSPVIEERIFLFMDLNSSTRYAEILGNLKFSSLLKDCFDDLNYVVNKFEADIYQYVGDEIVLTWPMKCGLRNANFIQIFFAFQEEIDKRSRHYLKNYALVPEFKAGAEGGPISVAEVGNIKRDIVFHGDVINTASRIESICNEFNKQYLVSGNLLKMANLNGQFESASLGNIQLKGKSNSLEVFAIDKISNATVKQVSGKEALFHK